VDLWGVANHLSVGIALVNSARDTAMTHQADQAATSVIASSAWTRLSDQVEFRKATNHPYALVFFSLNDCLACWRVGKALTKAPEHLLPSYRFVVAFQEFNPRDIAWMRELRVAATPQLRLYRNGALIAGAQGIDPSLDDAALVQWIVDWLSANAGGVT